MIFLGKWLATTAIAATVIAGATTALAWTVLSGICCTEEGR